MTISFSNFDSFEKPKTASSESADAEFKAGDFAAFFNVSAFVAPVNAPVKFAAPKSSGEIKVAVQPIESNPNFFKTDNQITSLFPQNTNGSAKKEEILNSDSAVKKDADFQTSAKPQNIAGGEIPTTPPRESAPSLNGEKSVNQKPNAAPLLDKNLNVVAANNFVTTDTDKIKIAAQSTATTHKPLKKNLQTEPFVSQNAAAQTTDSNQPLAKKSFVANFTEPNLTLENPSKASLAEEISGQNPAVKKDFGQQLFAVRQNVTDEKLPAIFRHDFAPPLSEKIFQARMQIVNAEVNQTSMEFIREKVLSNVPKLFSEVSEVLKAETPVQMNPAPKLSGEISNIVKADNLVKASSASDFVTGEKIVAPVLQVVSGESGRNLYQPETESAKVENQFEIQANPGGHIFNNLLNSVTNEPKIIETAAPIDSQSGKVFEQVEPRIFELAAAMQSGDAKRILKMRLNPAELGAVEITLEKNAAGVINAHFQTESETTRQVLNESLAQLRDSLENSGWKVGSLEISCDSSSSNGGERGENQSKQFGTAENKFVGTASFDGNSKTEDDQNRLVNLRA